MKCHIRWAIKHDVPKMLEIERNTCSRPWDEDDFYLFARERSSIMMVAERNGHILGHMVYTLTSSRIRIDRIVVHKDQQRCGIGRSLIRKLIGKLSDDRRHTLEIDVPDDLYLVQFILRECGLRCTGVQDDTYQFAYSLPLFV